MPSSREPTAPANPVLSVEFGLERGDLLAFNLYTFYYAPSRRQQRWIGRLFLPLVLIAISIALAMFLPDGEYVAWVLVPLAVLWVAAHPSLVRRRTEALLKQLLRNDDDPDLFGPRRLSIGPDTLTQAGEISATTRKWIGIEEIVVWRDYAFLYINSLSAFIVPRRAFAQPDEFETFVDAARHYHRGAADRVGAFPG